MVIGDAFRTNCRNYPLKLAVKDEYQKHYPPGTNYTYSELENAVDRLANSLLALGLRPGDRVSIQTGAGLAHVTSLLALVSVGMIATPIDRTFTSAEIDYQIEDAGVAACIVDEDIYQERLKGIADRASSPAWIGVGEEGCCSYNLEDLIDQGSPTPPDVSIREDDIATLIYTSGTTGKPKGVPLSHRAWLHSAGVAAAELGIHPYTRWLLIMPLHTSGFNGNALAAMARGCALIVSNPDAAKVLGLIESERITYIQFSPTLLANIIRHPQARFTDFSHLERWFTSAAPISAELLSEAADRLGQKFTQLYGTTETALLGTTLRPEDVDLVGPKAARLTSIGKACLGYETKVVDDEGNEVGPGSVGEILVRGPAVAKGYWKKLDEESFRSGWWYSGDVVRVDEDGFYHVIDRKKDMILSGGTNIYPREVEDVLAAHPAVDMVCVVGVPDATWGENVKAVIVLRDGMTATEEEIIGFCKERMASYKKPKSVDFVPKADMPVLGGGYKVLRRVLRDRYRQKYVEEQGGSTKRWGVV